MTITSKTWSRLAVSFFLIGLSGGVASAQNGQVARQPNRTAPNGQFAPGELAGIILNSERNQDADSLLLAYGQAVTDPNLARAAIAQLLSSYYILRNQAQAADQAIQAVAEANLRFQVLQAAQNQVMIQQNQQLIEQNAQIIELLRGRNTGGVAR
jgi:hypothetical protein